MCRRVYGEETWLWQIVQFLFYFAPTQQFIRCRYVDQRPRVRLRQRSKQTARKASRRTSSGLPGNSVQVHFSQHHLDVRERISYIIGQTYQVVRCPRVVASCQMLCCLCPYVFSEGYVLMSILVFLVSCAGCAILHYTYVHADRALYNTDRACVDFPLLWTPENSPGTGLNFVRKYATLPKIGTEISIRFYCIATIYTGLVATAPSAFVCQGDRVKRTVCCALGDKRYMNCPRCRSFWLHVGMGLRSGDIEDAAVRYHLKGPHCVTAFYTWSNCLLSLFLSL